VREHDRVDVLGRMPAAARLAGRAPAVSNSLPPEPRSTSTSRSPVFTASTLTWGVEVSVGWKPALRIAPSSASGACGQMTRTGKASVPLVRTVISNVPTRKR
jgi:hypothetical protein